MLRESKSSNVYRERPEVWTNTLSLKVIPRFLCCFVALFLIAVPVSAEKLSPADKSAYKRAFKYADKGNWKGAARAAAKAKHPLPAKALQWMRIGDNRTALKFREIVAFIDANPHWPHQLKMQRRAESEMNEKTPSEDIYGWFRTRKPSTGVGAFHLTRALLSDRRVAEAKAVARRAWVELNMNRRLETQFQKRYRKLLRPEDHIARLDRLLWDRKATSARRQLRRMSRDYQWLGLARIALMRREPGVDHAVSQVPKRLIGNHGLTYERIRWRRKNRLYDKAIELMQQAGEPRRAARKWWTERRILTRWLLRKDRVQEAYELVRGHGQSDGLPMAEGEWLAGWIALRGLHRYVDSFEHFKRMFENVSYPVSKARAAYWAGRAAEASGEIPISQQWYAVSARHVTSFYGQLAAAKLPETERPSFPPEPKTSANDRTAFANLELVRLVRMLGQMNLKGEVDPFVHQLARKAATPKEYALIAGLAADLQRQDLAIHVAKRALREGLVLSRLGYPELGLPLKKVPDPAFVQALVRQESAFDPRAISRAGARGLMQLMPGTALRVARKLNIPYSRARLTRDPKYNVRIGRAYLLQMLEEYNGSPILALAAYNAGPARVNQWLKTLGDPNHSVEHAIDWIESIPFYETRNYVQRVLENFTVYRDRDIAVSPSAAIDQEPSAIVPLRQTPNARK